jgi:hypothetical protein
MPVAWQGCTIGPTNANQAAPAEVVKLQPGANGAQAFHPHSSDLAARHPAQRGFWDAPEIRKSQSDPSVHGPPWCMHPCNLNFHVLEVFSAI